MADVIRLSLSSLKFSSSTLLTSWNSLHLGPAPNQRFLNKRLFSASSTSAVAVPADSSNSSCSISGFGHGFQYKTKKFALSFKVYATVAETTDQPKWWEKNVGPNMIDIHSTQEFLNALSQAGERLVIVEFYGTWCGSCRALFPKLCKTAQEHPEIMFLKVNFDENKPMCKNLNVRVLPYFHFYRGADGQLEAFSCSLAKFQKIKDAVKMHNTDRCSIGPPKSVGDLNLEAASVPKDKQAETSSK